MSERQIPFEPPWMESAEGASPEGEEEAGRRYRWDLSGRRLGWADRRRLAAGALLILADLLAAALSLGIALAVEAGGVPSPDRWVRLFPLLAVLAVGGQAIIGTYGVGSRWRRPGLAALAALLSVATGTGLAWVYPVFRLSLPAGFVLGGVLAAALGLVRWAGGRLVSTAHRRGLFRQRALVVATEDAAAVVRRWLRMHGYRQLEIATVVPPPDVSESEAPLPFPELGKRIEEQDIRVVLVLRTLPEEAFRAVAYQCFLHGADLRVVNPNTSPLPFRMVGQDAHGLYEIELAVPRLQRTQVVAKRALDLVLSGVLLAVLSPVFAAVAAAVKLDSPGPVFFEHERLGQGGSRFDLLKFRTMVAEAEERLREDPELYRRYVEHDYKLPPEEDPRITRIGRVLRTTSLDELPQLLNVLRGEMSLVGPRPIVPPEIEEYGVHAPVLLGEKPGVTGFWQIAGRSSVGYPQRARWEIAYVENWSLWLDLRILFWTIPVVLRKVGAH